MGGSLFPCLHYASLHRRWRFLCKHFAASSFLLLRVKLFSILYYMVHCCPLVSKYVGWVLFLTFYFYRWRRYCGYSTSFWMWCPWVLYRFLCCHCLVWLQWLGILYLTFRICHQVDIHSLYCTCILFLLLLAAVCFYSQ